MAVGRLFLMLKADDEVHCILAHFIGRDLRLEIESAKRTVPAPYGIKFWIEIINAMRFLIDQLQVEVTGTLETTLTCFRKIAGEPGSLIQQLSHQIFKVTAHFVDSRTSLTLADAFSCDITTSSTLLICFT